MTYMEMEDLGALSELRFAMRVQLAEEILRGGAVPIGYEAQTDDALAMLANLKARAYEDIIGKYRLVPQ